MNTAAVIRFPKPPPIKGAIVNIQKNEDGYTPLPNFICDEGYLAILSGEAIKCLVFLNRHINGFHIDQKAMGEVLVMKITGIKDNRTIRKYMAELARYQLVEIHKENGKKNTYSLTFSERLSIKPVAQHVTGLHESTNPKPSTPHEPSTSNAVTSHATTPVAQHVPTTSDTACHSVKEIYLKENLKKEKRDLLVDNSQTEMFCDSVKYHTDNSNLYSLRELASEYPIQTDLKTQAKNLNSELSDEFIFAELKNFAQWSTSRDKTTAQGWMNYWIYRIQKLKTPKAKSQKPTKPKSKGLSDPQINFFASKLCNHHEFASMYSGVGESHKEFEIRVATTLRNPKNIVNWASYLHDVGFVGTLEGFA